MSFGTTLSPDIVNVCILIVIALEEKYSSAKSQFCFVSFFRYIRSVRRVEYVVTNIICNDPCISIIGTRANITSKM